jgi:hypothetical protein
MRRYKSAPSIVLFLNVLRLPDGRIPKLAILGTYIRESPSMEWHHWARQCSLRIKIESPVFQFMNEASILGARQIEAASKSEAGRRSCA